MGKVQCGPNEESCQCPSERTFTLAQFILSTAQQEGNPETLEKQSKRGNGWIHQCVSYNFVSPMGLPPLLISVGLPPVRSVPGNKLRPQGTKRQAGSKCGHLQDFNPNHICAIALKPVTEHKACYHMEVSISETVQFI